jgi:hypothetical protein
MAAGNEFPYHLCARALQMFCTFHYMLLTLDQTDPLTNMVDGMLKQLIADPTSVKVDVFDLICAASIATPSWDVIKLSVVKAFLAKKAVTYSNIWLQKSTNTNDNLHRTFAAIDKEARLFLVQAILIEKFARALPKQKMLEFYWRSYLYHFVTTVTMNLLEITMQV